MGWYLPVHDSETMGLLKSETILLLLQALDVWDGAGVQRVRTQLWDHVVCFLS